VVVPSSAILHGASGDYVFLLGAENKVSVRVVKLGPADGERVAILSGLQVGDRVVIQGTDKLKDGTQVTIGQAQGGSTQSGAAAASGTGAPGSAAAGGTNGGKKHRNATNGASGINQGGASGSSSGTGAP
jgi:multidrug efflux system membrane fusion protein